VLPRNRFVEFNVEGYLAEEMYQDVMVEPVVEVPVESPS
jgi:hypothetical protein